MCRMIEDVISVEDCGLILKMMVDILDVFKNYDDYMCILYVFCGR